MKCLLLMVATAISSTLAAFEKYYNTEDQVIVAQRVTIDKPYHCERFDNSLILLIKSSPENSVDRRIIRQTWARDARRLRIAYLFALGIPRNESLIDAIESEDTRYGDIIQANFIDDYRNLTLKSIFMLNWMNRNCRQAKWYFSGDDDVVINIRKLKKFAETSDRQAMYGYLIKNPRVNRNVDSKYYLPESDYPDAYFPDYLTGAAYLINGNLVDRLYREAVDNRTNKIFIDDVYITGILAERLNIDRRPFDEFRFCYDVCCLNAETAVIECGRRDQLLRRFAFDCSYVHCFWLQVVIFFVILLFCLTLKAICKHRKRFVLKCISFFKKTSVT